MTQALLTLAERRQQIQLLTQNLGTELATGRQRGGLVCLVFYPEHKDHDELLPYIENISAGKIWGEKVSQVCDASNAHCYKVVPGRRGDLHCTLR